MNNLEKQSMAENSLNGLALGAGLFLGGLFLTVWTWGVGGLIGIPMMLYGLFLPFWCANQAAEGHNWMGWSPGESAVKTTREMCEERDRLAAEKTEALHRLRSAGASA